MKTVSTPKGTTLPLMQLKGKDYLQVAHRLIWFNEVESNFAIDNQVINLTDEVATVRTTISIFNKEGNLVKRATGTKTEHKKDFADFLEKSETGSLGRALAMLGYGTQFAIADLDEGERIVDSPMLDVRPQSTKQQTASTAASSPTKEVTPTTKAVSSDAAPKTEAASSNGSTTKKTSSFRKPAKTVEGDDGWGA